MKKVARRQCRKCPWKQSSDPFEIPNGYDPQKHRALKRTIAAPGALHVGKQLHLMACHETGGSPRCPELPCVGWLVHQLGPGNNIPLRMAVFARRVDGNVQTVGPQHARFEDTLPSGAHG